MDHSVVADQVRNGLITEEQARTHPLRNRLTQSISAGRESVEQHLGVCDLELNDAIVFCSDGLWGTVSESQIQAVTLELPPQKAADKLIALANTNLGPDNISVIIVRDKRYSYIASGEEGVE